MTTHFSSLYQSKLVWVLSVLITGLLIGFYIFQLNSLTTLAWHISEVEQQLTQIKHQNTALEAKAYQGISFRELEKLAKVQNFQKITSITYLVPLGGSVAQNQ